jgi:hypothetical protein
MTTWVEVADQSNTFTALADAENGYVMAGYVANDYITGILIWDVVSDASTVWAPA